MHKYSAMFFAILLTINVVCSVRLNPIDASMLPNNSIKARLTSMLVEVQTTENPKTIQAFLSSIQEMMHKLQDEQKKHQEISDKMMKQCTEEDEFRKKEVSDANDALRRTQEATRKCKNSLASAEKDLPELKHAHQTYIEELKKATEQREKEHKQYLEKKRDYEEAIAFLKEFIEYVKTQLKDFKAFSFVQHSEKLLRHATRLGMLSHAVPALIAMATQGPSEIPAHNNYSYVKNEDAATKLKDTLNTLLKRIEADWKDNEETEAKAQAAFEQLKAKLTHAINTLAENIAKTEKQIQDMTKCITDEAAIEASAQNKLNRNASLKESASKMCSKFAAEFIHATNSRLDEIKTVNEILVIIEKRFGQISPDLKNYLTSVQNGWEAYKNSTDFHKFEEYNQKHLAVNEHGANLVSAKNLIH